MIAVNRRSLLRVGAGGLTAAFALPTLIACQKASTSAIRIGWQTAWAPQGQVIEAMKRTNIPAISGVDVSFQGFQFGPDLNEAAISNGIDVTNAGIVPVINLLAKSPGWAIVGRQTDFYVSIIARPSAGVRAIGDLRGKRLAVPIGGGSHPYAIQQLHAAGLGDKDVVVVNVPPTEMLLAFKKGDVDAVAVWDPVAQLVLDAGGNVVAEQRYVGFVVANASLIKDSQRLEDLLVAYGLAYFYAARHRNQVDNWFAKDSGLNATLIGRLRTIEPNFAAAVPGAVKLVPHPEALSLCQSVAGTMFELGLLKAPLHVAGRVISGPASLAERRLTEMTGGAAVIVAI